MGEEVTVTDPKDSKQMEFTTSEERMGVAASGAVPEEDASEDKEMAAKGDEKDDSKDAAEDTPENDKEAEDKAPTDMDMDKDEEPALDAGLHPFLLRVVKGRLTRDSPVIPIQVFPYSTLRDVVSLLVPHFPSLASRLVSVTLSAVSFSGDTAVSTNSLGTLQNSIKPLDSLDGKTLQEAGIQSGHFLSMTLVEGRESAIMAARGTRLVGAAARLGPRVGSHRDTDRSEEPTGRKSQPNRSREIDPALFGIDSRHERRGEERGGVRHPFLLSNCEPNNLYP